ncbi:MAG: HD domain-containing protein [Candidatus Paceibacterota bacterium]|jgi:hypothetical protein
MDPIYLKIWELAKPYYEQGRVYDIPHIEWMMEKANGIADTEQVDKKLLLPVVILHDVGYSAVKESNPNIKDQSSKIIHMREGAKIAEEILGKVGYDGGLKNKIVYYISVHDNWVLGDDKPFKECKEMAIFNDLDFLWGISSYGQFILNGQSMGKTPQEAYAWWLQDEKLERRPFCCETTKVMFADYMKERKTDIEKQIN